MFCIFKPNLVHQPGTLDNKQFVYSLESINFIHSVFTLHLKPWYHEQSYLVVAPLSNPSLLNYVWQFISKVQLNVCWVTLTEIHKYTVRLNYPVQKWWDEVILTNLSLPSSNLVLPSQSYSCCFVSCWLPGIPTWYSSASTLSKLEATKTLSVFPSTVNHYLIMRESNLKYLWNTLIMIQDPCECECIFQSR